MAAPEGYSTKTLKDFVGHEFPASDPVLVDQERVNAFAETTGDHQWIHVDVERAKKESPFGGTIAHGFLSLSMLAGAAFPAGCIPSDAQGALNYGLGKVRFLAPVPVGSSLTFQFKIAGVEDKGPGRQLVHLEATAMVEGGDTPAVIAEVLAMVLG
ncbi:MaoC family dehydratase [Palleronia caenipelagi]|uniref:MaoC family dehydratase n=1 Tax=Palleronia caenipelagi TaxID=2489174 RepID=A0A547Q2T5_9RHOB|nr:MaoC family dehydratase [Palleronia caenipelagi]TRD20697.1 MaoC family dehydratase [Palleronia caenipelagi]